jgi:hypothetical protein
MDIKMDELAEVLKQAKSSGDPRPFYEKLLESVIYVYTPKDFKVKVDVATNTLLGLEIVSITNQDGERATPFFTSMDAMGKLPMDNFASTKIEAWKFLAMMRNGNNIAVINPNSEIYHKFQPAEIEAIVCREVFAENGIGTVSSNEGRIAFLDPYKVPVNFVDSIKKICRKTDAITEAVLAYIYVEKTDSNDYILLLNAKCEERELVLNLQNKISSILQRGTAMRFVFDYDNDYCREIKSKGLSIKKRRKSIFSGIFR